MANGQLYLAQRDNDQRFSSDHELGTETCTACQRVMEERWTDMWYVNDVRMGHEPIKGPGQRLLCSQRCNSQLVYDTAPEEVRSLMRMFARMIHEWSESVTMRSLDWSLSHSFVTHAVPRINLVVLDDEIDTFAKELLGRDWRDANYPQWFEDAIAPVTPAKPVEFIHLGLGATR